jgi:hypothetical protein
MDSSEYMQLDEQVTAHRLPSCPLLLISQLWKHKATLYLALAIHSQIQVTTRYS